MPPPPLLFLLYHLLASAHGGELDPPPTQPPDPRSKPLVLVKIWSLIIVFAATFLAGVSPYLVKWKEGYILLGTQFAGGVFLGTALMQFLGDSDTIFDNLTAKDYPFAFTLASVGYLLTMLADCIVLCFYPKQSTSGSFQHKKSSSSVGTLRSQIQVDVDGTDQSINPLLSKTISFVDSVLLITFLCLHSIFQGISIGVTGTKPKAWRSLCTVALQNVFVAIAMGISLLRTIPDRPLSSCTAYAFAFAISCPIGIAIGMVIDVATPGIVLDWIYAVFLGLASGVFVYVSVNHLLFEGYLPRGRVLVDTPRRKFLAVVFGVTVVAVVRIWDTSSRAYGGG